MNKEKRVAVVKEFGDFIKGKALIFVDYCGVDMPMIDSLRGDLYGIGACFRIFKNTLLKRAVEQSKNIDDVAQVDDSCFSGMTATAIVDFDGFFASGKSLLAAEKKKFIVIKGGIYEGKFVDAAEVRLYGSMPSRQDLYSELVRSLDFLLNDFVFVLDGVIGQKQKSETSG